MHLNVQIQSLLLVSNINTDSDEHYQMSIFALYEVDPLYTNHTASTDPSV